MSMAPLFLESFPTVMGRSRTLSRPESLSLTAAWHKLFFWQQSIFLFLFIVKWQRFTYILGQEAVVVVRDNGRYLIIHCELHPDSLHVIFLIKYTFEYLFSARLLFVIDNLLPLYLHPLIMVVIVEPPEGQIVGLKGITLHIMFLWTGEGHFLIPPPRWIWKNLPGMFLLEILFFNWIIFEFLLH